MSLSRHKNIASSSQAPSDSIDPPDLFADVQRVASFSGKCTVSKPVDIEYWKRRLSVTLKKPGSILQQMRVESNQDGYRSDGYAFYLDKLNVVTREIFDEISAGMGQGCLLKGATTPLTSSLMSGPTWYVLITPEAQDRLVKTQRLARFLANLKRTDVMKLIFCLIIVMWSWYLLYDHLKEYQGPWQHLRDTFRRLLNQ